MFEYAWSINHRQFSGLCSWQPNEDLSKDKPLFILLHGWQDNAASFSVLFPLLTPHFSVIAIDLSGHGLSTSRGEEDYFSFWDYLDDLNQWIAHLQVKSCWLLGHSLGALLSVSYAASMPEMVDGLILIEGLAPLYEEPECCALRLRQGLLSRQRYRKKQQRSNSFNMKTVNKALERRSAINQLSTDCLMPLVIRGTKAVDNTDHRELGIAWRHDHKLRSDSLFRMTKSQSFQLCQSVQASILSCVGTSGFDRLRDPTGEKTWFPSLQQIELTGGHHCHLEEPEALCRAITHFFNQCL